jgi:hypothetical protein
MFVQPLGSSAPNTQIASTSFFIYLLNALSSILRNYVILMCLLCSISIWPQICPSSIFLACGLDVLRRIGRSDSPSRHFSRLIWSARAAGRRDDSPCLGEGVERMARSASSPMCAAEQR